MLGQKYASFEMRHAFTFEILSNETISIIKLDDIDVI